MGRLHLLAKPITNVFDCVDIRMKQQMEFKTLLPAGFYNKIEHRVTTAAAKSKKIKSLDGKQETADVGAIFNRLLLISNVKNILIDMQEMLKYELTTMPLSMFTVKGLSRICKSKSALMNSLKKDVPTRGKQPDLSIVDGCMVLWKVQWPSANGTVNNFVKSFHKFLIDILDNNDVCLVFDRYN